MANKCTHTRSVTVDNSYVDDWTGEKVYSYEYEERYTYEDIDLHRYRCTQCGEIGYYSGRARDYYEKGIKSKGIKGLE